MRLTLLRMRLSLRVPPLLLLIQSKLFHQMPLSKKLLISSMQPMLIKIILSLKRKLKLFLVQMVRIFLILSLIAPLLGQIKTLMERSPCKN